MSEVAIKQSVSGKISEATMACQASTTPSSELEVAIVCFLSQSGFQHKRIAALFDCNQGRVSEVLAANGAGRKLFLAREVL